MKKTFKKLIALVLVGAMCLPALPTLASVDTSIPTVEATITPAVEPSVIPEGEGDSTDTSVPAPTPTIVADTTMELPMDAAMVSSTSAIVGDAKGIAGKLAQLSAKLMVSKMEKYFDKQEAMRGNEAAGFLSDLIRNNTADDVHEILEIVKDLEVTVDAMYSDMKAGFDKIDEDLRIAALKHYIEELGVYSLEIKQAWAAYDNALAILQASKEGEMPEIVDLNDPAFAAFFSKLEGMDLVGKINSLCVMLNVGGGDDDKVGDGLDLTLYGTVKDQYKSVTILEHQYTDMLIGTYQAATGMQIQLLGLYAEYCDRLPDDVDSINTLAAYVAMEDQVAASINAQQEHLDIGNTSHETIYDYNEVESGVVLFEDNVNIEFSNGNGTYPAFQIVSNRDGYRYVIVNNKFKLHPMVQKNQYDSLVYEHTKYFYQSLQSRDGRYIMPADPKELDGLFGDRGDDISFSEFLVSTALCDLSFGAGNQPNMFMLNRSSDKDQCFIEGQSKTDTDMFGEDNKNYYLVRLSDIADNYGKYFNYVDQNQYRGGDLTTYLIYKEAKGSASDLVTINSIEELKKLYSAGEQTIDLTNLANTHYDLGSKVNPHVITLTGKVTIKSKPQLSLGNVLIRVGEGAEVTLENLNIRNEGESVRNLISLGDATVIMEGVNVFESVAEHMYIVGGCISVANGKLTLKGSGSLEASITRGGPAIQVPKGTSISIEELTLKAKVNSRDNQLYNTWPAAIGNSNDDDDAPCGSINISNKANVTIESIWPNSPPAGRTNIGSQKGDVSPGKIENCKLTLSHGGISEEIEIGEQVEWNGEVKYRGVVKTMDFHSAGTNSRMYMEVVGTNGKTTGKVDINSAVIGTNSLGTGKTEKFEFFAANVGEIDHIRLYSEYSNVTIKWRPEYITIGSRIDNFKDQANFGICEWIENKNTGKHFYRDEPVLRIDLKTANDSDAGSNSTIRMTINYVDENGNMQSTWEKDCHDYIAGDAYEKNTTDTIYINCNQVNNKRNIITKDNFRGITFKIAGNDGWKLEEYKYALVTPWNGKTLLEGKLKTSQWINDEQARYALYIRPEDSVQYRVAAKTKAGSVYYGSNSHVYYGIIDDKGNSSKLVWSSHNSGGDTMEPGKTDEFNAVFDIATDNIEKLVLHNKGSNDWTPESVTIYRVCNGQALSDEFIFKINKKLNDDAGKLIFSYSSTKSRPLAIGDPKEGTEPPEQEGGGTKEDPAQPTPTKAAIANDGKTMTAKGTNTGDDTSFLIWLMVIFVSGVGVSGMIALRKKKQYKNRQ